jgi:hypothetical protein
LKAGEMAYQSKNRSGAVMSWKVVFVQSKSIFFVKFYFQKTANLKIPRDSIQIAVLFSPLIGTIEKYGEGKVK